MALVGVLRESSKARYRNKYPDRGWRAEWRKVHGTCCCVASRALVVRQASPGTKTIINFQSPTVLFAL
jgi:hypothetical protein